MLKGIKVKLLFTGSLIILSAKVLLYILYDCFQTVKSYLIPVYKDISKDVVLITGAANGIGREMCLHFAKYCPNILALDMDVQSLKETIDIVQTETGVQIHPYKCDLRSVTEINDTVNQILRDYGRVTILVNNAGIIHISSLLDLSLENIDDCFKVNFFSHIHLIKAFLPGMLGRSTCSDDSNEDNLEPARGHIVCISSGGSLLPISYNTVYCASKSAVLLLSESLELELQEMGFADRIHITSVMPYVVRTKLARHVTGSNSALFPLVEPDKCAKRIVDAVRLNKSVVYIPEAIRIRAILHILSPNYAAACIRNYIKRNLIFSSGKAK
ncbi:unnamed protein product [Heterobilharzia americana]|nr:unnamed protein product [Heterobilharzia americana]